jgi:hypothetical protein
VRRSSLGTQYQTVGANFFHLQLHPLLTIWSSRIFSPRFSVTLFSMASVAWEADAFYCRGSIIDTCQAMLNGFVAGIESTRRSNAWRTFCRYIRYMYHSIAVRQGTDGSHLTTTEQGHIPALDTMDGLAEVFSVISTTLLLNVINY